MKIRAGLVVELGVNLVLPWLAYRLALPHWGELGALYASAVPPVVWSLVEFARSRRVDALSVLVPILEDVLLWNRSKIHSFFESHGFALREWDKIRTDTITFCPAIAQGATVQ